MILFISFLSGLTLSTKRFRKIYLAFYKSTNTPWANGRRCRQEELHATLAVGFKSLEQRIRLIFIFLFIKIKFLCP